MKRTYHSPIDVLKLPTLLKDDVVASLTSDDFEIPLADLASDLPPGKQNHLRGLAGSAHYDYVFHSGRLADHIDPLNSQPIWELMLKIPTYTILTGGISRGLARRAFYDLLPSEIRTRQVKGSGTAFYQSLVRKNRNLLREGLLDGLLIQQGYLDRRKLLECLMAEEPFMKASASQLLSYFAVEIWLQRWTDIRRQAATPPSPPMSLAR